MVAVNLRYPAPSSPLVLLLRVPGDTHPRRHVIVHVSSDWASALEVLVLIFSWTAIDRRFAFSMCRREVHVVDVWCVQRSKGSIPVCYSVVASHVLTLDHHVAMLHLQRHLLASDARGDVEIMYQQRHDRDWLVGKLILKAPERIYTVGSSGRK